jgi:hypothetical protein
MQTMSGESVVVNMDPSCIPGENPANKGECKLYSPESICIHQGHLYFHTNSACRRPLICLLAASTIITQDTTKACSATTEWVHYM